MPKIKSHYLRMMDALLTYQNDDGMWRQLVDDPEAWDESSCTAMFAYAMAVGVNRGLLDEDTYKPRVQKAWLALVEHIDEDGRLEDICVGTGKQNDHDYYLARPRQTGDFHGQAPVLWLATELLEGDFKL